MEVLFRAPTGRGHAQLSILPSATFLPNTCVHSVLQQFTCSSTHTVPPLSEAACPLGLALRKRQLDGTPPPISQWQSRGRARGDKSRRRRAGRGAIRGRLWLGLAWLLLARAPGAAGTPNSPRRPRSYTHLEGDVRWRRLFSTHFFLCVDPSGRVQGTRWRDSPDSVFFELRPIRVSVVALKAMNTGFYVAMNRRGRLSWSRVCARFRERIEENGYDTYASVRWRHRGRPMFLALDAGLGGRGGGAGARRRGVRTQRHHPPTHSLPVLVS
ncbi:LOW QUALITY PROTEIN: fibroblast growth factor 22 [Balaenoptera acutorostrata]|uniref:LOW QUALITY PROTEIN: fibroblast growth factor 22 n=1 Tax=Balaenoptera acutorostrata TaxID=9767 RepID=A0ABM3T2Y8_BALAC|nr:LOW QUALITY PROTEIN: fibroblast growth factor 22 [Balaenoptera acutorostrata]